MVLNVCQHGRIEIEDLEHLGDASARDTEPPGELSLRFTVLFHGPPPFARDAYGIGAYVALLAGRGICCLR
ncbi:MAG: hypothetical protein C3F10_11865 [Dehalococcoidia bacterium]|nr:MAG: hypothetical protein C3F10_11865 [Dehalococcoidia bacterium]